MIMPTESQCAAVVAAAKAYTTAFEQVDGRAFVEQAGELRRRELAEIIQSISDVLGWSQEMLMSLSEPVSEFAGELERELEEGAARIEFANYELGEVVSGLCPQGLPVTPPFTATPAASATSAVTDGAAA